MFAGGDLQTGPWVAIGAVAAGKEAAESILRYIEGCDMAAGREPVAHENPRYRPIPRNEIRRARARMPELPLEQRRGSFKEVELGFEEPAGRAEAGRCVNCGYCCECLQCVDACLAKAVDHHQLPMYASERVQSLPSEPALRTSVPRGESRQFEDVPDVGVATPPFVDTASWKPSFATRSRSRIV